jgi:hypothetical protein
VSLFSVGQIVATPGALDALQKADVDPAFLLRRHLTGDWGDMDEHDRDVNDAAVQDGNRIMSAYVLEPGVTIWIITERDRSATTLLLPDEY